MPGRTTRMCGEPTAWAGSSPREMRRIGIQALRRRGLGSGRSVIAIVEMCNSFGRRLRRHDRRRRHRRLLRDGTAITSAGASALSRRCPDDSRTPTAAAPRLHDASPAVAPTVTTLSDVNPLAIRNLQRDRRRLRSDDRRRTGSLFFRDADLDSFRQHDRVIRACAPRMATSPTTPTATT